jgi:hypothetical protein
LLNENWHGKPKYLDKTCLSATLSTTNPTWFDLGLNLGHRSWKLAANCLSYGKAFMSLVSICFQFIANYFIFI